MRAVLADVGAQDVPEIIVLNKADLADPLVVDRLRRRETHSIVVSARTGEGIDELRAADRRRAAAARRSRSTSWCPTTAATWSSRVHDEGELLEQDHAAEGTRVRALVGPALAAELAPYAASPADRWLTLRRRGVSSTAAYAGAAEPD